MLNVFLKELASLQAAVLSNLCILISSEKNQVPHYLFRKNADFCLRCNEPSRHLANLHVLHYLQKKRLIFSKGVLTRAGYVPRNSLEKTQAPPHFLTKNAYFFLKK